jgi:hypothetical protein
VMEPKAGKVPGTNEPTRLAAPRATSSLFGLIECENRAPFCFAATMESRKPMMAIRLHPNMLSDSIHYNHNFLT